MKKILLATAIAVFAVSGAFADDLIIDTKALEEVTHMDAEGHPFVERVKLETATPDQDFIYQISVQNASPAEIQAISLRFPIDDSLLVNSDTFASDIPIEVTYSVEASGEIFASLPDLKVLDETGKERPAEDADLTFVKIDIPTVPAQQSFFVEFRATVR